MSGLVLQSSFYGDDLSVDVCYDRTTQQHHFRYEDLVGSEYLPCVDCKREFSDTLEAASHQNRYARVLVLAAKNVVEYESFQMCRAGQALEDECHCVWIRRHVVVSIEEKVSSSEKVGGR